MTLSISRKTLALLAAALLACTVGFATLVPQSAHAVQAADTSLDAQTSEATLGTQAAKKSIYVRTALGTAKYAYNKYGLATKIVDGEFQWRFKYNGAKLVKATYYRKNAYAGKWLEQFRYSFKYDSKNRVKKVVAVSEGMPNDFYNHTATYTYNKKNQVTKKVTTYPSGSPKTTVKYYYNSKGLLKKIVDSIATETIKYDSKGNRIAYTRKYAASANRSDSSMTYKNTIKNGRLVKVVTNYGGNYENAQAIKYAKKSVPKKYAAAVKAQQKTFVKLLPDAFAPSVFSFQIP